MHIPRLLFFLNNDFSIELDILVMYIVPQGIEELKKLRQEDILVIVDGIIPAQDYDFLYQAGVATIFCPGISVKKAACEIMKILNKD